jgi:hypothetical protein
VSRLRKGAGVLAGVLAADLLLVLVTGSWSFLDLGRQPVGPVGFALRAGALGGLLVLRFRVWADHGRRLDWRWLTLWLLLLPTLMQFQYAGGRINGDGVMYYVYVRSVWKDFDLDLTNEYTHYGLISRGDLAVRTTTGLRRSIFSIGPAVVWSPHFLLGEAVARVQRALGGEADLSGYGPTHRNAVALGSLLYGFAAVLLIHGLLRRHFGGNTALGGALLVWGTTFLHWYMVQQPTMSHAPSAFGAAFAIWLWDRQRGRQDPWAFLVVGLTLGVAMCIRWQNGVLLMLPGLELLGHLYRAPRSWKRWLANGLVLVAAATVGAFPQMAAWKSLYDMWILPYPPHGTDFVRLDHPFVLQTLFSSRHGLLSWTPVFWAGYLGFLPLLRRRARVALPLLVPLLLMTYVNMCSGDWWAGGSFSNRRFDSLLPILALGIAASIEVARRWIRDRPELVLGAVAVPLTLWNTTLAEQVRRDLVPRDDTVSFPRLVENGARLVAGAVGSPQTWPASWLFAWQTGRSPGQYDELVGRYLFYRQGNMRGHIEIGDGNDTPMLGEGWGRIEAREGVGVRRVHGRARLFAPLDVPRDLEVRVRASAAGEGSPVGVWINARLAGRFWAGSALEEHPVSAGAGFWRRELNDVILDTGDGEVWVDSVVFKRVRR